MSRRTLHYENALQAERSLWIVSNTVIRRDFKEFASKLDLEYRYPGPKGIGWRSGRVAGRPAGHGGRTAR